MKKLHVNVWMARDMIGFEYHVVYAESATKWDLIVSYDDKVTAEQTLAELSAELEEELEETGEECIGKYYLINNLGKIL